jgi:hypothetical protein
MNGRTLLRPAAAVLTLVMLSGCGVSVENDGHMFQRLADGVTAIPVTDRPSGDVSAPGPAPAQSDPQTGAPAVGPAATAAGLRAPMVIDVVERDAMPGGGEEGLRTALNLMHVANAKTEDGAGDVVRAGLRQAIDVATPAVKKAVFDAVAGPGTRLGSRPSAMPSGSASAGHAVQLAAFPNAAAAHKAWRALSAAHPDLVSGLTARFEQADLGARGVWVRLKVGPVVSAQTARRVCAAAGADPERCADAVAARS